MSQANCRWAVAEALAQVQIAVDNAPHYAKTFRARLSDAHDLLTICKDDINKGIFK